MLVVLIVLTAYGLTNYYFEVQIMRLSEQKVLSELDLYHEGVLKNAQEKIKNKINIIEVNSRSSYLYRALNANVNEANNILEDVVKWKDSFDMLIVLDVKGNLLTIAGLSAASKSKIIHGNYATRDYFINTIKTKKTYISKLLYAYGNYWSITVSAPIFDQSGNIKYILVGSDKLENIFKNFNFNSRFSNLYSVLVNQDGDLIAQNQQPVKEKINLSEKDQFIKNLIKNGKDKFSIIKNYKKEKVFVRGSVLNLGNNNKFYIFSYLPYGSSQQTLESIIINIRYIYLFIFIFATVVFVFTWLLAMIIIKELINNKK